MRLVEIESEYLYIYIERESYSSQLECSFSRVLIQSLTTQFFSIFPTSRQESSFFQPILNRKMGATSTDNDKMDTGGEETTTDKEEEIDPSKTLINNVSLIKKSVESKGEPRFIASVFRQVRFRFSDLKPSSSSSSSFVDLSFSLSLSFFLSFFKNSPPRILHTFLVIYDKP